LYGRFGLLFFFFIFNHRISNIHAFCTPAGSIGWILGFLTGCTLVVDSYEPHAEVMLEAGVWKKKSLAYRILFTL
jgi:hypothetical protein